MATREQAIDLRTIGTGYPAASEARTAGYAAREVAYMVEDAVLDFLYAARAGFLAIPEIAMLRAGSIDGQPLENVTLRDKVVTGILLGTAFAAMVAVAVIAG